MCLMHTPAPTSPFLLLSDVQMFDWIMHNKSLFLAGYTEIGTNHSHAMELQTQHNHFAMNCMVKRPFFSGSRPLRARVGSVA